MEITIKNRTIFRVLVLTTLFIALILFGIRIQQQVIWLAIAGFLALALEPAVSKLSKFMPWKSRGLSLVIVFALFIGVFSFLIVNLIPPLVSEATQLVKGIPNYTNRFLQDSNVVSQFARDHLNLRQLIGDQQQALAKASTVSAILFSSLGSILSSLVAIFTILLFTFLIILEGPNIVETFWKYQPAGRKEKRVLLAAEMYQTVAGYVNGTLIRVIVLAISTMIVLAILHLPYFLSLGILVGIFGLIPLIGGIIGSIIVVLLSLVYGTFANAVVLIIFFVIYSFFENYILTPIIFRRSVKISPLLTGVATIFGVASAGFVGALVSIPVAASLQILAISFLENQKELDK